MRRFAKIAAASLLLAALAPPAATLRAQAAPPHAWLFGTWTGGLFPAASSLSAEACLAQPVVIFTQDVVMRASLTETGYLQRIIATARQTPRGADIQFSPAQMPQSGLMGMAAPASSMGFGCPNPDTLQIERHGANEISFPGCADFPNPLVRCPGA